MKNGDLYNRLSEGVPPRRAVKTEEKGNGTMGIIKAIAGAVSGNLADQWLEVLEADNMTDTTVCAKGVTVRRNDRLHYRE